MDGGGSAIQSVLALAQRDAREQSSGQQPLVLGPRDLEKCITMTHLINRETGDFSRYLSKVLGTFFGQMLSTCDDELRATTCSGSVRYIDAGVFRESPLQREGSVHR